MVPQDSPLMALVQQGARLAMGCGHAARAKTGEAACSPLKKNFAGEGVRWTLGSILSRWRSQEGSCPVGTTVGTRHGRALLGGQWISAAWQKGTEADRARRVARVRRHIGWGGSVLGCRCPCGEMGCTGGGGQ
jgi:hypothetical protein